MVIREKDQLSMTLAVRQYGAFERPALQDTATSLAGWLVRMNHPTGMFQYRVNLNPDVRVSPRYNELRHAGAIYALSDFHQVQPTSAMPEVLARSARFLRDRCMAPVPRLDEHLAIWSIPDLINKPNDPHLAKLGGTGLGLVALLSVELVSPGQTSLAELQQLGRFLLFMQRDDGSFYSKYVPSRNGRDDRWVSLYYPGEAALGLIMLYERDGQRRWLDAGIRSLGYLARIREGRPRVEADHWAVLATARLHRLHPESVDSMPMAALQRHVVQICESMLADRPPHPPGSPLHGCFTADGRTTPTATRLEGLLAALEVVPADETELRNRILSASAEGIAFLLRAHVSSGEQRGAMPRAFALLETTHPNYSIAFNRRATEVRIDYVQHALSAMLAFDRAASELHAR